MSDSESDGEEPPQQPRDTDDTHAVQQVGDFVSLLGYRRIPATDPLPPLELFPTSPDLVAENVSGKSVVSEARTLFTYYLWCLQLIEASTRPEFQHWDWLDSCMGLMAAHSRVSDKMKLRYFLHNKDNVRTFRMIQKNFKLNLDKQFHMGKMNLLHIACDSGWWQLAGELVEVESMDVNLACPSPNMRPGNLTPLMLASGAGHTAVVRVLLARPDLRIDQRDTEGFTALFHACNHGKYRVGDQHGYFRRLWSWDLSQQQLLNMESLARENAMDIIQLLISHGSDIDARDRTGATALYRASTVENFEEVIKFLVDCGIRVTQNILNWARVKNPGSLELLEFERNNPRSLARLSRTALRKSLGSSSPGSENFSSKLQSLREESCLPLVLFDYLIYK